ncbi:hypothetical protein FOA52_000050 [Chlamydomonas sp. UWO 241]|nr:hypothetical protein FOA52_000050 [Chlamydomonas sp. UWO 241]
MALHAAQVTRRCVHQRGSISRCARRPYVVTPAASNPLGVHALVLTGSIADRVECARAATIAAGAGYTIVEVPLLDPWKVDGADTRAALSAAGLRATTSLGLGPGRDINSEDEESVRGGRELLMQALSVSSALGATHMCGVLYSALAKYPGPPSALARANARRVIADLARAAQPLGITICLEVVNRYEANLINTAQQHPLEFRYETNLINTAQQALDFIDGLGEGCDNVKVHLDTYHMNIEEESFSGPVVACGDRLGYVHIGESNRGYLGRGTVDFDEVFSALKQIGYTGPITFESFSSQVVHPQLSNTLCVWRDLWSDSEDIAAHAAKYMRGKLAA